jgi:hypothetical protein
MNSEDWLESGTLYYSAPGVGTGKFHTEHGISLSDVLGTAGLILATIALVASIVVTWGGDSPAAIPAIGMLWTGSAILGAGAGISKMIELYSKGDLTWGNAAFEIMNIAACLLPAGGAISKFTGRAVKFFSGNIYVLVSEVSMVTALGVNTMYFTYDFIKQIEEIDKNVPPGQKKDAYFRLIMFGIITGIFTFEGAKGLYKARFSGEIMPGEITEPQRKTLINEGSDEIVDPAAQKKGKASLTGEPIVEGNTAENVPAKKNIVPGENGVVPEGKTNVVSGKESVFDPVPGENKIAETETFTAMEKKPAKMPEMVEVLDGQSGKSKIVGEVQRGAKVKDLITQLRNLTRANGIEYAVVKYKSGPNAGKRMIVSGNENGIAFDPEQGELEYLYMHSHPENLGASAEDYMSLYNLNQSKQVIVKPNGEVQIRKPVANENGDIVNGNKEVVGNVNKPVKTIQVRSGMQDNIDWNAVVPRRGPYAGENRIDHIRRHNVNDITKENHGVFNGDGVDLTNQAWTQAKASGLVPNSDGEMIVPFNNAGYKGGSLGDGSQLNSIKIIVIPGTNKIITAFPF